MTSNLDRLLDIMARLRHPTEGCPWDIEQDFASIAPYTIAEAYEVADAIAREDRNALREELGDLLLTGVYHARMADEERTSVVSGKSVSVRGGTGGRRIIPKQTNTSL